jgi:hypothetical protein
VDESGRDAAEDVKEKISDMSEVILDVVTEDVKKPHIPEDVENPSMEKHRRQKREKLLECSEVSRNSGIEVSERNDPIDVKSLIQTGALGELP